MSEQELLRTALVLPPRARRVLCVWAAVPGLVCAPFAFWQSVWAGAVFCAVWAALVALVRARCCNAFTKRKCFLSDSHKTRL